MADDSDFQKISDDSGFEPHEPKKPVSVIGETRKVMSRINEDAIAGTLGAPVDWVNRLLKAQGLPMSEKPFLGSESIKSGMRYVGASKEGDEPETIPGKAVEAVGGGAVSALLGGGGIGGLTREVGDVLASPALREAGSMLASPSGNIAAGAGAGAGGAIGGEAEKGTPMEGPARAIGELVGGFAGGIAPSTQLRPPSDVDPVIGAYERLKLAPSAGEAGVGGRTAQWLEGNILPQTIGGGGVMEKFKQRRLRELTDIQKGIAEQYGAPKPRAEMGKAVQESIMDTWNQVKEADGQIIGRLKAKYGSDTVYPSSLVDAVANPVGAAVSKEVRDTTLDPLIQEAAGIIRDTNGRLTFADLSALKAKYGYAMEPGFQKNVNDAQVSQLFNAVKKDMEQHIKGRSPEDYATLQASNKRYSEAQDDFKKYFKKLIGSKNVPVSSERAYEILTSAATEKARGDQKEFQHVWDAMPPEERGNLSATILSRLGATDKGNPGNPETWSLGKFLSGYRELSPEAKDVLFKQAGNGEVAKQLDDLVTVTRNIQDRVTRLASSSRSGTGAIMLGQFGIGALASHVTSGDLSGFLYTMGGPYVAAEMLTNPMAVKAVTGALRGVEAAIDASARAVIAMQAIPRLPQQQKKAVGQ